MTGPSPASGDRSAVARSRLPPLVEKALVDVGYDVLLPSEGGWIEARISGHSGALLVQASPPEVILAMRESSLIERLGLQRALVDVPQGFNDVAVIEGAAALHGALRLLHSIQIRPVAQLTGALEARLAAIPVTERTREVRQRIGQDLFREALFELWDGRCAISGVRLPKRMLRASHAQPWADATDEERLDPFNGLLLAVHYDALFDAGLIAIADTGEVLTSPALDDATRRVLGLSEGLSVARLLPGHAPYLQYHRQHVAPWAS